MSTLITSLLWILVVTLLLLGIWPIALILIILLIINGSHQRSKELEEIKAENQRLHQELETKELKSENEKLRQQLQDQAVRHAMDQAESRKKD